MKQHVPLIIDEAKLSTRDLTPYPTKDLTPFLGERAVAPDTTPEQVREALGQGNMPETDTTRLLIFSLGWAFQAFGR